MPGRDRDAQTDELLRRALQPERAPSAGVCLDAETLASWTEDRLTPVERGAAEAHAAGCSRCQALLATMVRTVGAGPATAPAPRGLFARLPWLVPLTASVVAVALWIAVRPADVPTGRVDAPATAERPQEPAAASPPPATDTFAATPPGAAQQKAEAPRRDANSSRETEITAESGPASDVPHASGQDARRMLQDEVVAAPSAPAPSAEPRAEAGLARSRLAALPPVPIASADAASTWRIVGGRAVQMSTDGGLTWADSYVALSALTAGSSPAATICWVVGEAGTVLLTVDGTQWERRNVPGGPDLAAVVATDAQSAVVTTVDGRVFSTADAGRSWVLR